MANIILSSKNEKLIAAVLYIFSEAFNWIRGKIAARIVGWPHTFLGTDSKILGSKAISVGINSSIKRQAWIEAVFCYFEQTFSPSINIGQSFFSSDRLHISCINKIQIGDNCVFGSGVYISDHNHGLYKGKGQSNPSEPPIKRNLISLGPVIIGNNVWLGDNVVIVGPVLIGDGVVIGANSVVTQDVPCHILAAGAPLKVIKKFNEITEEWERLEK